MSNTFHSGYGGTAKVGTTALPVKEWSVRESARIATFDNSLTGGIVISEQSGGRRAQVTLNLDYDFDNNPLAAPINLRAGQTVSTVQLTLNGTVGYTFPSLVVETSDLTVTHTSTEGIPYNVTGYNAGSTYYGPGDSVPGGGGS